MTREEFVQRALARRLGAYRTRDGWLRLSDWLADLEELEAEAQREWRAFAIARAREAVHGPAARSAAAL